jgi:hypothetical protein
MSGLIVTAHNGEEGHINLCTGIILMVHSGTQFEDPWIRGISFFPFLPSEWLNDHHAIIPCQKQHRWTACTIYTYKESSLTVW